MLMMEIIEKILIAVVPTVILAGINKLTVKRKHRFDHMDSEILSRVIGEIALEQQKPMTALGRLKLIALYGQIKLTYPLPACQALLSFISRKALPFSDPQLVGFLSSERVMTRSGQTLMLSQGKFMLHLLLMVLCFFGMAVSVGMGVALTWPEITMPTGSQMQHGVALVFFLRIRDHWGERTLFMHQKHQGAIPCSNILGRVLALSAGTLSNTLS
ncbi:MULTISPECIES: hypothetical protein [unclassified Serratia (in: enterobacteria)]|uniref:hypothetical protein n=1 Tax=unclassified Serratia (in: enterobacteria) TaxID=2647522 RepID=UPI00307640B2